MTDSEIAALYAACFPNDRNLWSVDAIAQFRRHKSSVIFEKPSAALLLQTVMDEAEIVSIFVSPANQQQGEGASLLSDAIEYCLKHGIRSLFLEVAADNQSALKLYKKFNFEQMGKRKAYYARTNGSKVDALTMRLDL